MLPFLDLRDDNFDNLAIRASEINAVCFDTPHPSFRGRITLYLKPGLSNDVDIPFNAHNVRTLRDWCGCFSPPAFESYLTAPTTPAEEPPAGDPQP